ncbi:MAG: hypothetical protein QXR68_03170 [Pyrobaculum sp.]
MPKPSAIFISSRVHLLTYSTSSILCGRSLDVGYTFFNHFTSCLSLHIQVRHYG